MPHHVCRLSHSRKEEAHHAVIVQHLWRTHTRSVSRWTQLIFPMKLIMPSITIVVVVVTAVKTEDAAAFLLSIGTVECD